MAYILFKNINKEDIKTVIDYLEENGYTNSHYGPDENEAVGVCTTSLTLKYTYLSEGMCTKENPHVSWVMCRKETESVEDFKQKIDKQVEIYNEVYKDIIEKYM